VKPGRQDIHILRELGKHVAEIAALPEQQETIALWKALNSCRPVRPMVMIDQIPWHEMDVDGELTLQTEHDFSRSIEADLRRRIYRWKHMPVDWVIEPVVTIPKVFSGLDFGIRTIEELAVMDPDNNIVSHQYADQLENEKDLCKIKFPEIVRDENATRQNEETAAEIFEGILEVRMQGIVPAFALWDRIVEWRTPEKSLMELVINPDHMHRIMARLTRAYLVMLDQLEAHNLLDSFQPTIHCTGAFNDELPAPGFDPEKSRAIDLWTCGMAQIFSSVSPEMHQEFELEYANKWYERFGLVYYGCCEPLHKKIHIVRHIPNLRKISMSPWVDQDEGAEQIGGDFVFSRKPNPAYVASEGWDTDIVTRDLRETVDCCKKFGCPLELILKDISTVCYKPQRLWEWADIAMNIACG